MRERYECEGAFPTVFEKVSRPRPPRLGAWRTAVTTFVALDPNSTNTPLCLPRSTKMRASEFGTAWCVCVCVRHCVCARGVERNLI